MITAFELEKIKGLHLVWQERGQAGDYKEPSCYRDVVANDLAGYIPLLLEEISKLDALYHRVLEPYWSDNMS